MGDDVHATDHEVTPAVPTPDPALSTARNYHESEVSKRCETDCETGCLSPTLRGRYRRPDDPRVSGGANGPGRARLTGVR
jgi:hypothetical protein